MAEKLKELISGFIKIPADQIDNSTAIDRSVVKNSILLHRMYARLKEENIVVNNYWEVRTFGDLVVRANGGLSTTGVMSSKSLPDTGSDAGQEKTGGIGIDIEEIISFPDVDDYRADSFYTMNFADAEIAYCILQRNPKQSFAGIFAAKEAIVKVDNKWGQRPFSEIVIGRDGSGKPYFNDFLISISHSGQMAVAVAQLKSPQSDIQSTTNGNSAAGAVTTVVKSKRIGGLDIVSLVLAAAALAIALLK